MADVVVTVPMNFTHSAAPGKKGLAAWLAEGDRPGETWSGNEWYFSCGQNMPNIVPGERVYVVCEGRLVGYAPLIRVELAVPSRGPVRGKVFQKRFRKTCHLVRGGGAVACTIDAPIIGFLGYRYRWWDRAIERPLELPK